MTAAGAGERAIHIGHIDWAARWRELAERREARLRGSAPPPSGGSRWDGRAERFARLTAELDADADPLVVALRKALRPEDTLIDAGAGAGRYTLPLAVRVRHVTAVEPSTGMRTSLAKTVETRGLTNVTVVGGTWQEAEVEPADVVLCSHVLYFVADVVPFIEKLDRHARRACYIYLRVDARDKPLGDLWRAVWNEERPPEPGFLDLYNLLFSMGIRANVELTPMERGTRYDDLDDAVEQTRQALLLDPDDHRHDARVRSYLTERLQSDGDHLAFQPYMQTAIVSWNTGG